MKSLKRILIIFLILALTFLGLRYVLIKMFNTSYMGMEKEIEQFKNNISTFENSALALSSNTGETDVEVTHGLIEIPWILNDKIPETTYYDLDKKLRLELWPSIELGKNEIEKINQSDTWKILKKLDYEKIKYGKDWVFFVNRSGIGGSVGMLYYTGEMPEYVLTCEIEKIMDNWYHCFSS